MALPVVLLMILAYSPDKDGNSTVMFLLDYYRNTFLHSIPGRFQILFILDNFVLFNGTAGIIYAASVTALITIIMIISLKNLSFRDIYARYKFIIVVISVTFSCYLFLPDNINGQNVIFERYSVLIFLMFIIFTAASDTNRSSKTVLAVIAFVCIIHSFLLIDYMSDFRKDCSDFNESIFPESSSNSLSGIITDRKFRGRNVYAHFPMYYTVWKKGITSGIVDFRFGLIRRKASYEKLPHFIEWYDPNENYNMHYRNIDYLLVSGSKNINLENFLKYKKSGNWILYRNKNIPVTP